MWPKVQECHLAEAYRHDENVRMYFKIILALSLYIHILSEDLPAAFDDLVESNPTEPTPMNDY